MRIALATEQFTPSNEPAAHVTRAVVTHLTGRGHEVVVFAGGRGQASFAGARLFWASRMTPISAVREAMAVSRPDVCHLIDPHRVGLKAAEAAERLGVPTVYLAPERWSPGVDLGDHHAGLRDDALHDRWTRVHSPDGGQFVVGYAGPLETRKVISRLHAIAGLPGVRLVALGDGPGTAGLRAAGAKVITSATGIERARCLATFDVLVQPRKKTVYAPVVLEALASGVPVVGFATGTAAAAVQHEVNGLLVAADRGSSSLLRAVARLAASPDLRLDLAASARASVVDRGWDKAVDDLLELHYPQAVGRFVSLV